MNYNKPNYNGAWPHPLLKKTTGCCKPSSNYFQKFPETVLWELINKSCQSPIQDGDHGGRLNSPPPQNTPNNTSYWASSSSKELMAD